MIERTVLLLALISLRAKGREVRACSTGLRFDAGGDRLLNATRIKHWMYRRKN